MSPCDTINPHILRLPESQTDRSPILVTLITVLIVPLLSITEEKCLSMTLQGEVLPTETESSASRCISHSDAVLKPVLYVVIPSQFASNRDIAIFEVEDVHYFGDGVITRCDFYLTILTALLKRIHNGGTIILGVGRCHGAKCSRLGHTSENRNDQKP